MSGRIEGKIALVVGAAQGIGEAIATRFVEEGAKIVIADVLDEAGQATAKRLGGTYVRTDISDFEAAKEAVSVAVQNYGTLDIIVQNAGIYPWTLIDNTPPEEWDQVCAVNLRGTFLVCREVLPHMVRARRGRVVNLASSSARMADDDLGPYTASKWAVAGYTTSLARSVRPHGVRVNGVNPGWVDTDMSRAYQAEGDEEWSTPQEIADAILYLLTLAPRDMTGQFLDIFGS